MDIEKKREILKAAKKELTRHSWDTLVDDPPAMAQGGPWCRGDWLPHLQKTNSGRTRRTWSI
jgi:hypothetical protein